MRAVDIATSDGSMGAWVFAPQGAGPWPAVLFFMDAIGLRPELAAMAERLAGEGFCVLLPDLYYRAGRRAPFDAATVLTDETQRAQMLALYASIDGAMVMRDTRACIEFLAAEPSVRDPGIGCLGYCMGGRFALLAAGHFPDRVLAAACLHGAGLATASADSPHRLAAQIRAALYIGVAEADSFLEAGETERLREALTAARVAHTIEVYPGARHGFAVPGLEAYEPAAAERHWQRLLELFRSRLVPVRVAAGHF